MDPKEVLLRNINDIVVTHRDELDILQNKLAQEINKWDITKQSYELSTIDSGSHNLIRLFLATLATEGRSDRTLVEYQRVLRHLHMETGISLYDITAMQIRAWLADAQDKVSLRTCSNYRAVLSSFFGWARREGLIDQNPMEIVHAIKYEEEEKEAFSDVDIDRLRGACQTLRERAELEFMLSSGARVNEIALMDVNDINFNTKEVTIKHGKGNKQRHTYINDICLTHLMDYLNSRKDMNKCLFATKKGKRMSVRSIENDIAHIGTRAGVQKAHPHRCRRTFATMMIKKGMDVRTIQILLGHRSLNTTMRYVHLSDSHIANEYRKYA